MVTLATANVEIRPDFKKFDAQLRRGVKNSLKGVEKDTEKTTKKIEVDLEEVAEGFFKAFKFSGIIAGISGLVPAIVALGAAAGTASAALGLLPAAGALGLAVFATLKIGIDALKKSFSGLQPAFASLRKSVSNTLVAGFSSQVKVLAATLMPALKTGLTGVAAALNQVGRQVLTFASSQRAVIGLGFIFANMKVVIQALVPVFGVALQAITDLIDVGMVVLAESADSAAASLTNFFTRLDAAATSGSLEKTFEDALAALAQLGRIAGNVLGTLKGIFTAGADSSLLNSIETVTAALDRLTNSVGGQEKIRQLFDLLKTAAPIAAGVSILSGALGGLAAAMNLVAENPLGVVIGALAIALVAAYTNITPFRDAVNSLAITLGGGLKSALDAITEAFNQLGPTFTAIGNDLAPVAKILGDAFTNDILPALKSVGTALKDGFQPVLNTVADVIKNKVQPVLALFSAAVQRNQNVINVLSTVFGFLIKVVGGLLVGSFVILVQSLIQLGGVIVGVVLGALGGLLDVLGFVFRAVVTVFNFITSLPGIIASAFTALVGFFSGLISAIGGALTKVGAFFAAIPGVISTAFSAIGSFFSDLLNTVGGALATVGAFFASIGATIFNAFQAVASFVGGIFTAIFEFLTGSPEKVVNFILVVRQAIIDGFNAVLTFITGLPAKILSVLTAAGNFLATVATNVWNGFTNAITTAFNATSTFVQSVPGKIVGFFTTAGDFLANVATTIWNGFTGAITTAYNATSKFISGIPGKIIAILRAQGDFLRSVGTTIWNGFTGAITTAYNATSKFISGIPGKIIGFFSGAKDLLVNTGKDIMNGLFNGIKAVAEKIKKFMEGLKKSFGALWDAFSKGKGPTPAPHAVGQSVASGLAEGMNSRARLVTDAAENISASFASGINPVTTDGSLQLGSDGQFGISFIPETIPALRPSSTVTQNINVVLPTGDPEAAALSVANRIAAAVA